MKRINLNEEELSKITVIVDQYRNLETEFDSIQTKLLELDSLKVELIEKLDKNREIELSFFDTLSKKYGKGKLDLLSLEYIKK